MEPARPEARKDFRAFLQNELLRKCRKNPGYSVRAFARSLGVDQSLLSKILRGRRRITTQMILKIGSALGLPTNEIESYVFDSKDSPISAKKLDVDQFHILSDWYNFAILELVTLDHAAPTPDWIAKSLNITSEEAKIAIERLIQAELLINRNGKLIPSQKNNIWADTSTTTSLRKRLQKQFLSKAVDAVDTIDYKNREQGSMTLTARKEHMPIIKERIEKFKKEIERFCEESGNPDDVYQLVVSFFPLSDTGKIKEKE